MVIDLVVIVICILYCTLQGSILEIINVVNSYMNFLLFQVLIGGTAQIIQPNITAENGFVHVIDKVRHKR